MIDSDDFVELLSEEAHSTNAAYHTFVTTYQGLGEVHVFYEGEEDTLYYTPYIRRRINGRQLNAYVCGGKWKVVEVRGMIGSDYPGVEIMYFIDRDYDDCLGRQAELDDLTYLTDHYSVENELTTEEAFDIVVSDFCGLGSGDAEYVALRDAYRRALTDGPSEVLLLMAWALAIRSRGDKANLNNVDLKHVLSVDASGRVSWKPNGFERFKRSCAAHVAPPSVADVRRWVKELRSLPAGKACRGKFALWLFESVIATTVPSAVKEAKARGKKSAKLPNAVREKQYFEILGGRLTEPATLKVFLDERLPLAA